MLPFLFLAQNVLDKITRKIGKKRFPDIKSARYGDVIGVDRGIYRHYGIYVSDESVIEYGARQSDFGENLCVHETTLQKFLGGEKNYFICVFPEVFDRPLEVEIRAPGTLSIPTTTVCLVYSPQETVRRARSRMNENQYHLALNNCEHFAFWCKTGMSRSFQVESFLGKIPCLMIRQDV